MSPAGRLRLLTLLTLLGALLLFGVEPLVGRLLLPACGGGFHVWATCLTFFQGTLLLGYLYCHLLAPRLGRWHLLVAATPLLFLPLALLPEHTPAAPLLSALSPAGLGLAQPDAHAPVLSVLRALTVGVAVPFGVLATTGVVAQAWLAASDLPERHDPYPLYAASNAGSLVALLAYPLLVEPFVSLRAQRVTWSGLFLVYLALLVLAAPRRRAREVVDPPAPDGPPAAPPPEAASPEAAAPDVASPGLAPPPELARAPAPGAGDVLYWLGLSAAPSMFLVAVTNVISIDIGSLPLVWVVPLALYLLSFVLVFGRRPFYPALLRRFWPEVALVGAFFFVQQGYATLSPLLAVLHLVVLLTVCLVGHGELHLSRPAPRHLTAFYLVLALGGWLGGAFASLVAPRVLTSLAEYVLALLLLATTLLLRHRRALRAWVKSEPPALLAGSLILVALVAGRTVQSLLARAGAAPVHVRRNAYGVYRVTERALAPREQAEAAATGAAAGARSMIRMVLHGTTWHGAQVLDPRARRWPITYYHPRGPLGEAHLVARARAGARPLAAGVVGLGAGTAAAYFDRPGDTLTFYELDPDVLDLARTYFHYLDDCQAGSGAAPRVVLGDARLQLERDEGAPPGGFDVLLIDAFSSDAIPVHLLTREALEGYARRLAPGGLLLFHVSNRYYELQPALAATARAAGLHMALRTKALETELAPLEFPSDYAALALDAGTLDGLVARRWTRVAPGYGADVTPWTDDFANLLGTLRWPRD